MPRCAALSAWQNGLIDNEPVFILFICGSISRINCIWQQKLEQLNGTRKITNGVKWLEFHE